MWCPPLDLLGRLGTLRYLLFLSLKGANGFNMIDWHVHQWNLQAYT